MLEIYSDYSLDAKAVGSGRARYQDAYNYLRLLGAGVLYLPPEDARRQLAEFLNWPFCLVEDWGVEKAANRRIKEARLLLPAEMPRARGANGR